MSKESTIIKLKNVNKTFRIKDQSSYTIRGRVFSLFKPTKSRKIHALRNINIEIEKGDILGVIGNNGSGKSTLLKIMGKIYDIDKGGNVFINGNFQKLTLGTGFDPELTARENIFLNASLSGLSLRKTASLFDEIIHFAGLNEFVNTKVKYFSSGMISRLAFSIAKHVDAEILFLDEFFGGVGDVGFQKKSEDFFQNSVLKNRTIIYVSHDLETIKRQCNKAILLDKGEIVASGKAEDVIQEYLSNFKSDK